MKSSKPKKPERKGKSPAPTRQRNFVPWIVGGLVIVGLAGITWWQKQPPPAETAPLVASPSTTVATNTAATTAPTHANLPKLKGKWQRSDGDYVIEIKSVEDSGRLSAAYLNPASIHVAKAEATHADGATKVFIELQDVNYPGCTYTLVYLPERDQLAGIYYQALQQQSYEVYFERMP